MLVPGQRVQAEALRVPQEARRVHHSFHADEGQALNLQYRGRDYATNVLSFPADLPPGVDLPLIAQLKPGDTLRFGEVSIEQAHDLLLAREREVQKFKAGVRLATTRG